MEVENDNNTYTKGSFCNEFLSDDKSTINETVLNRVSSQVEIPNDKYIVQNIDYSKQYCELYNERLLLLKPVIKKVAQLKWPNVAFLDEIRELKPNMESIIYGTIFVTMKKYKSILDETLSVQFNPQMIGSQFLNVNSIQDHITGEDDILSLEDEISKVTLSGSISTKDVVTGCVVALKGIMENHGIFNVHDISYPEMIFHSIETTPSKSVTLALLSGLNIGASDKELETQLAFDYLTGLLGGCDDHTLGQTISRVILVGNSVNIERTPFRKTRLNNKEIENALQPLSSFDLMLSSLLSSVDVDIIPGRHDATSGLLPQQPLHKLLFQFSRTYNSLHTYTNPCEVYVNGIHILLTSGYILEDIKRQLDGENDPISIMKHILTWGIICPTAPNTSEAYPFTNKDPFILTEIPNVFIVGNQDAFRAELYRINEHSIYLITLPEFSTNSTMILLHLDTMSAEPVSFNISL